MTVSSSLARLGLALASLLLACAPRRSGPTPAPARPASRSGCGIAGADPLIREVLLDRARVDRRRREPALLAELRRGIHMLLAEGTCSRASAARHVGMHERALLRRLHAHGTTFQAVLDETRQAMALEMLRHTDATVARVAVAVGYRDTTVFTRAFRRWIGVTPREFRLGTKRTSTAASR